MVFHGGFYYCSESRNGRHICIRRSRKIREISRDAGACVWTAPTQGRNSNRIWAPELHLIDGKWLIYFATDDGQHENRRMWVLESEGPDPRGSYVCRGMLDTGGWAIDGTVLTLDDGRRYFLWSGWPGGRYEQQNLYMAPMKSPTVLAGPRILIAAPDQPWERVVMPICEGPQVLKRNGDIFVVYSASAAWTSDCCLGLLRNRTNEMLNPANWVKYGPVFTKTPQVWGIGYCSFVKSLGQTEDWIIYHSKSGQRSDGEDRQVQAKRFAWTSDGFPDFNTPPPGTHSSVCAFKRRSRSLRVAA